MNAKRTPGRRLLRYTLIGLLNLLVLVVVVALAAPLLFDPNDWKDTIAREVKERTGREITIAGDMQFSVLPWLGVTLGEVRVGNAEGFGEAPFARLDAAEVRVKLLPLLGREVRMDTVVVRGLELALARDVDGRGNWEDLARVAGGGEAGSGADPRALAAFALGGVRIEDAALRYADAASGERASLTDIDLRTGPVSLGEPVDATLSLRFEHPRAQGRAEGSARLRYDLSAGRYGAEGLALSAEASAPELGEGTVNARVTGAVSYDDAARLLATRGLEIALDAPPLPGAGLASPLALSAGGDVDLRLAEGTVTSAELNVRLPQLRHRDIEAGLRIVTALAADLGARKLLLKGLRSEGELRGGPLGEQPLPLGFDGDVTLDLAERGAQVKEMRVRAGGFSAGGELHGRLGPPYTVIDGSLAAPTFALRELLARAGIALPATRDPGALSKVSFNTRFQLTGRQLTLAPLELALDGTRLDGRAAATPGGAFALDVATERLDVDRYLPPESNAAPPSAAAALPLELLRGLNVKVRLRVGALRYAGIDFSAVDVGIDARGGQVRLHPLQAELFGGSYSGDIRIDARGEQPVMQLDERVAGVDAHALLAALGVGTGGVDLSGGRSTLALKAQVTADAAGQQVRASEIVLDGEVGGAAFQGGPVPVRLRGAVAVDLAARRAQLEKVQATFAELAAGADLELGFAPGELAYSGNVRVEPFDARALAGRLGIALPPTRDPKAFTRVGIEAAVDGGAERIAANPLRLGLDGSTASGRLAVDGLVSPAFAFDLEVDRLDADRYLPPAAKGKAATPGAAAIALPLELVRSLALDGTLKVGTLSIGGVEMRDVQLTATAKDGLLELSPLGAVLYDGRYDGNVTVDARGKASRIALDETIRGIQIGPLLADVRGDAPLTGSTDLRAVLTATGGDTEALKRTVSGDLSFAVRDGALEKVDMVDAMCGTLAALDFDNLNKETIAAGVIGLLLNTRRRPAAPAAAGGTGTRTEFTEMTGSAKLSNGVARNDDLVLLSPVVRVRGAGTVDLPQDRIDYRAEAELVQSCAGIGRRDLSGHLIPVSIVGPIADPAIKPEIPVSLIQALRKRRASEPAPAPAASAPAPAATAPGSGWGAPIPQQPDRQQQADQRQQTEPQQPKRGDVIKDARDEAIKGILKGLFK